jgi:hypothetical protein
MRLFKRQPNDDDDSDAIRRVAELAVRVQELAEKDTSFQTFGSKDHQYRFNPPLSVKEVEQFEVEYAVSLPEDYREFLICIGNGGAGPYYGLLSLQQSLLRPEHASRHFLSSPFPLTEAYNPFGADDDLADEESGDDEFDEDDCVRGSIAICHWGCGYYSRLVISGPEKGQVWADGRDSFQDLHPTKRDFFGWYSDWLYQSMYDLGW